MEEKKKDNWDKVSACAGLVSSIFIPLAVVYMGSSYATAQKTSENGVKFIELALSVLSEEPKESSAALRDWAVDVLAKNSPVSLSAAAQAQLKNRALPNGCAVANATATGALRVIPNIRDQAPSR